MAGGPTTFQSGSTLQADQLEVVAPVTFAGSYQANDTQINGDYAGVDAAATFTGVVHQLGSLEILFGSADFSGASLDAGAGDLSSMSLLNATLTIPGNLNVAGSFSSDNSTLTSVGGPATLTLQNGGVLSGGNTLDGFNLINDSTIACANSQLLIEDGGGLTNLPGAIFGTAGGSNLITLNGGTLAGSGTITADVTNSGQVIPGSPLGVLELQGSYSQSASGVLQVLLGGTSAGTQSAELQGDRSIALNGTLQLDLAAGFTPQVGDTFTILKNAGSAAVTGTFAGLLEGATFVSSGYQFQISYVGDAGHDDVTVVVEKAVPIFSLVAPPTIIDGTANTQITGAIAAGSLIPPSTETVTVTVNGVNYVAAINPDGTFAVAVPTASLGTGSYTICYFYAGDNNFTSASATANMDVTNGVLALFNQSQAENAGSTIPIQIELVSASGQDLSSAGTTATALGIAATTDTTDTTGSIDPSLVGALQPVQSAGDSNPNNVFREQGGSQPFYMYNLQTPTGLTAGTYRLYFSVQNDPLLHWVTFSVD